jgi:hypothetical protein
VATMNITASGTYRLKFRATGGNTTVYLTSTTGASGTFYVDEVAIEEDKLMKAGYRFGFNGQEKDDEVAGRGNTFTAEFWEYEPRLGRRWNIDPAYAEKPWMSPYHAFSNRPVVNIDPNGALDTKYEDEDGNSLGETKDGNDATVTVGNDKKEEFKKELDGAKNQNQQNDQMRNESWIRRFGAKMEAVEGQIVPLWAINAVNSDDYNPKGGIITATATLVSIGEYKMFNKSTWYSLKQMKEYSQRFNGNGSTGGKLAHGKAWSTTLKWTGRAIGVYNAYDIAEQYMDNKINTTQLVLEQGSNAYATLGGLYGAAWGVGWEAGRLLCSQPWYRENVRPVIQDALGVPRH